jgi:GntR family transcriptional regulator, transcriptional repressor for pyruvate dehydrogenase complex
MPIDPKDGKPKRNQKKLKQITSQLGALRREALTEQIVKKMQGLVLRGTLHEGERLPSERDLAEMLHVSRSSLRQALKALQVMGVLEVRHGSGNYLTPIARTILEQPTRTLVPLPGLSEAELFEARRALEAECAAAAAIRATEADLAAIRAEIDGMRENTHDWEAYRRHDLGFHHAIAVASGNRYFAWFLGVANRVLYRSLMKRPIKRPLQQSFDEHHSIFEAIVARDAARARSEMLLHVSYQKFYYEEVPADVQFVAYPVIA